MIIILVPLGILLIAATSFSIATRSVYGKLLKEDELDSYFAKHLQDYGLNPIDNEMFHSHNLPYIAKIHLSVLGKWHIDDYGIIPRWSKWSKRLDQLRRRLMTPPPPTKSLKDL